MKAKNTFSRIFFCPFLLWILLITGVCHSVYAGNTIQQPMDSLVQKMNLFFKDRKIEDPGGVLIITKNNQILYKKVFGKANLESNTNIHEQTVFEAASVSKQFTAAAILLLEEKGKLNILDDIRKYVPELPDYGKKITLQNLLTHTSGVKDWRNIVYLNPLFTANRLFTQDMALQIICSQQSLNFQPGDQYRYSNSGYDLLGTVVERVSGKSFASFIKEEILDPAGMLNSKFRGKYSDVIKNRANGYLTQSGAYLQGVVLDETYGAAGLYTTAPDLQKWIEFLESDKISSDFKKTRLQQFVLNDGTKIPYANGGVEVHQFNGHTEVRHGGLIAGYRAWLANYPEDKLVVSYLSNDRNIMTTALSETINESLFGRAIGKQLNQNVSSNQSPQTLGGTYVNTMDHSIFIELNWVEGKVFSNQKEVKWITNNQFEIDKKLYKVQSDQIIETNTEGDFVFKKVESISSAAIDLGKITGFFYSADCRTGFQIIHKENKLFAARSDFDQFILEPVYKDGHLITFRGLTNGLRALFHFKIKKNKVESLSISLPRAENIPFKKQLLKNKKYEAEL